MKRKIDRKIIFVFFILSMCLASISCISYAAVMYDNDIKNDSEKKINNESKVINNISDKVLKPAATYNKNITSANAYDKNSVSRYPEKDTRISVMKPYEKHPEGENLQYYDKDNEFTYIRHRYGIVEVIGDYEWQEIMDDDNDIEWRLLIHNSGSESGAPFYAVSGFYKVNGDTYCFDKEGHLIIGLAKDEYDIIYEFDDQGKFVKKYKQ